MALWGISDNLHVYAIGAVTKDPSCVVGSEVQVVVEQPVDGTVNGSDDSNTTEIVIGLMVAAYVTCVLFLNKSKTSKKDKARRGRVSHSRTHSVNKVAVKAAGMVVTEEEDIFSRPVMIDGHCQMSGSSLDPTCNVAAETASRLLSENS